MTGAEKRARVDDAWADTDEPLLLADGFDAAILGVACRHNETFVVYDVERVLAILMADSKMSYEDAREYFDYNVAGAHLPGGPAWMTPVAHL